MMNCLYPHTASYGRGHLALGHCKYDEWYTYGTKGPFPQMPPLPQSFPYGSSFVAPTSTPAKADDSGMKSGTTNNGSFTAAKKMVRGRFFLQGLMNKWDRCQWSDEYKMQEEIIKREAKTTIRQIVLGESTLVTCGAGMQVERILCGFQCCYLTINNLPQDAERSDVEDLFTSFLGIDASLFSIVEMRTLNGKVGAKVFVDADAGKIITDYFDGAVVSGQRLDISLDNDASPNKMCSSAGVLTVSWKLPPRTLVVHCYDLSDAEEIVKNLNDTIYCGARIQANLLQQSQRSYFDGDDTISIEISGVPAGESFYSDLPHHCYITDGVSTDHFDSEVVKKDLRRAVEVMAGYQTYEATPADSNKVDVEVQIRFDSWDNAKRAHDQLLQPLKPGYPQFSLRLPTPIEYSIRIPHAQYRAQKARWDSLCEKDDAKAAFVNITDDNTDRALIRVFGDDKKEVGKLKVRVENLVAGEALDPSFWHRSFLGGRGQSILDDIGTRSSTYIRCNWKTKSLKVYADGGAKEAALELLKETVDDLNKSEFSVTIGRGAVCFFMHKGLAALKNELGDGAAALELTPAPRLIVRGGESAHRIVDRLLEESQIGFQLHAKDGGDACPVCFDEPSSPVLLGCKHAYCTECISHLLISASDRKQFPLVCTGDNNKCGVPISIPLIQRFLSQKQFDQLLEAAVASHIEKHPQEFQYCTTADCKQVYRRGMGAYTCPSCFANICTGCDKDVHEGMTCEEREVLDNPAEQERRNEQWALTVGAKRCPTCRILVEKIAGCNRMTCRCAANFCWICLQVSDTAANVYAHLQTIHAGA